MNLNTRLSRLESVVPVKREPAADLSALTPDELKFLIRHHGADHPEEIVYYSEAHYQPYDEMSPEERQVRLEEIYKKIVWK